MNNYLHLNKWENASHQSFLAVAYKKEYENEDYVMVLLENSLVHFFLNLCSLSY